MKTEISSIQKCAAQHFGPWMVEPRWFAQAVAAVKAGTFQPKGEDASAAASNTPGVVGELVDGAFKVRYTIANGIAVVPFAGQVVKGNSSFGGASSVWTRQSVRKAANDDRISAILLHIDSPGGSVAGTGDLADDVKKIDAIKPVYTYFEDLGASAAYWIGSQARYVFANPTAQVGSIGTMTWVEDTSGAYEKAGIKVTLVATGKYKGQWIDGNPVSEEYIESIRTQINDLNEHFLSGVLRGRQNMTRESLMAVADGRVFIAEKAKQSGLIDQVASIDAALAYIQQEIFKMATTPEQVAAIKAEHPDVAQAIAAEAYAKAQEDLKPKAATATELLAAFPGDENKGFCIDQLAVNATLADATSAFVKAQADKIASLTTAKSKADEDHASALAKKDETIADLQGKLATATSGQGAVGFIAPGQTDAKAPDGSDPKALAEYEYDNDAEKRKGFSSKANYVAVRTAELKDQFRMAGAR